MRLLFFLAIFSILFPNVGPAAVAEGTNPLNILVIDRIEVITPKDVDDIYLAFSKQANTLFATIKFRKSGIHKLEAVLKSNVDKQISMTIGDDVVTLPVYLKTEKAFNPLTIQIQNEATALKLLKYLSH